MEQDYYLEPLPDEMPQESETPQTAAAANKKPFDAQLGILTVQTALCVMVLLACLVIKLFFGDLFLQMRQWYQTNIAVDTDIRQVLQGEEKNDGSGGPLESREPAAGAELSQGFLLPVNGSVSSPFGYRTDPITGTPAVHHGLDIAADSGTPILASVSGRVKQAVEHHADYGNYLVLEHGGFETLYGHCKELLVRAGDTVQAGDIIALCGSTGRSTGPHLHFEVRVSGRQIDPKPLLKIRDSV